MRLARLFGKLRQQAPASAVALLAAAACILSAAVVVPAQAQGFSDDDEGTEERDYWDEKNRGWFFYERKPKPRPRPPAVPQPVAAAPAAAQAPASAPASDKHPDLVRFEALQKRVEESRNIAIMNPTEENLRAYLEVQYEVVNRAAKFGQASQQVVWATPSLDPAANGGRPTSPDGLRIYDSNKQAEFGRKLTELSQTHSFFFFFRSDCPYCHRFAPTLLAFSKRTGIRITAISTDGRPIPGFEEFRPDNGIGARLGVQQVPALYLAEPRSGKILPVGYGAMSPSELEKRLDTITRPDFAANVPSAVRSVGGLQ